MITTVSTDRPPTGLTIAGLGEVNEHVAAMLIPRSPFRTQESVRAVAVATMIERVIDPGEVALMPNRWHSETGYGLYLVPVSEVTELEASRERGMTLLLDELLGGEDVYALPYYLERAQTLGVSKQFDMLDWLSAWRSA